MSSLAHADRAPGMGEEATANSLAVAVVYLISGMLALVYQLIWQRSLFTMYGINVEAVTIVVAGFLLGLGFGSLVGGYLSRRSSLNLLAVFGIVELIIGSFGILSLRIIAFVGHKTLHLPTAELTVVTLLLLFVPTLFMGSTLPILTAYLVRHSRNVGRSVGLLYCVNTVGSATACLASALFLMRIAGMQGAVTIAAAVNFIVGALALAEAWRTRSGDQASRRWQACSRSRCRATRGAAPPPRSSSPSPWRRSSAMSRCPTRSSGSAPSPSRPTPARPSPSSSAPISPVSPTDRCACAGHWAARWRRARRSKWSRRRSWRRVSWVSCCCRPPPTVRPPTLASFSRCC